MSNVNHVEGLSCQVFVCLKFVVSSVCLSGVGYGSISNDILEIFKYTQKRRSSKWMPGEKRRESKGPLFCTSCALF